MRPHQRLPYRKNPGKSGAFFAETLFSLFFFGAACSAWEWLLLALALNAAGSRTLPGPELSQSPPRDHTGKLQRGFPVSRGDNDPISARFPAAWRRILPGHKLSQSPPRDHTGKLQRGFPVSRGDNDPISARFPATWRRILPGHKLSQSPPRDCTGCFFL